VNAVTSHPIHRTLLILLLCLSTLKADLLLDDVAVNQEKFEVAYLIDREENLSFEAVKNRTFTPIPNRASLPSDAHLIWLKLSIKNNTSEILTLNLHQATAFLNRTISFFEVSGERLLRTKSYDYFQDSGDREIIKGSDAVYRFRLAPNEEKILYIQNRSVAYQFFDLRLYDTPHSSRYMTTKIIPITLLIGIYVALILYNLLLLISSRMREYLYYALYLLFALGWFLYEYGLFAFYFEFFGLLAYLLNGFVILLNIFLLLFVKQVLQTKRLYPKENAWLNSGLVLSLLNLLYFLYDPVIALEVVTIPVSYLLLMLIGVGFSIYKKRNPYVKYLLFAQAFYLLFSVVSILFYEGLISYTFFSRHALGFGIMIEAFLLSFLLTYRIRIANEEKDRVKHTLLHQERKVALMEEVFKSIAHQWRQPLSRINSIVLRLRGTLPPTHTEGEKHLTQIEEITGDMSRTIDDFYALYLGCKEKSLFSLSQSIQKSLSLSYDSEEHPHPSVTVDVDPFMQVFGYEQLFNQAIMTILHNAQEAFQIDQTQTPTVQIESFKEDKRYGITICDNAGGVPSHLTEKIFEPNFSTKTHIKTRGDGLSIAREIIQEKMHGRLTCHNTPLGACFTITFTEESIDD
jgi:signal transduction histidine kinase